MTKQDTSGITDFFNDPAPRPSPDIGQALRPGERVGKLRILGHIASGGMADIYKAQHEELEVIRAIKLLKPGYTREDRNRFETEAKISAHLHHPNIVQIYTVDVWQGSLPYIEMELIDGTSLAELIGKHRCLPCDFAMAICTIICEALAYAQLQNFTVYGKVYTGLVHRDIKPANILISKTGQVKLADFGIALPGNVSIHTVGANTMGTYSYLSPEQLDGKQLDCRSDIYSIGTVLYETITGHKAFPSHTLSELIRNKLSGSFRPTKDIVPDAPKSLIRLIEKSLARDREKRFNNIDDFSNALQKCLSEQTNNSPAEIVACFIQQPTQKVEAIQRKKRFFLFNIEWAVPILGGASVLAFIVAAIVIKAGFHQSTVTATEGYTDSTVVSYTEDTAQQIENDPATGLPVHTTPDTINTAAHIASLSMKPHTELPGGTSTRVSTPSRKQQAHSALNAITEIENYLKNSNAEKAIDIAEQQPANDGYFYLLKGQALYQKGNYDDAEVAFHMAQTTPSSFRPSDTQQNAIYWWALNRVALYRKKPNLNNKHIALNALQNYCQAFCASGQATSLCEDALAKIAELE